ncbi:MAG: C/D box methylation guide ribonucleoprotein complex aNOP56 subunit [Promethearchaeati archaeon SRVP18_Atabeyarchaeia-1]
MQALIVESLVGVFAFDDSLKLVSKSVFKPNPDELAKKVTRLQDGEIIDELGKLVEQIQNKGFDEFILEDEQLANNIVKRYGVRTHVETPSQAGRLLRSRIVDFSTESGFVSSPEDFYSLLYQVNILLTKQKIRGAAEKRDKLIVQAIESTDDIDKTLNLFASRIREWYGLYFPELSRLVENHQTYAALISKIGDRSQYSQDNLRGVATFSDAMRMELERQAKSSMGARIADYDLSRIRNFATIIKELYDARSEIEQYVDNIMKEVAPNVTGLAGSMIGARLLSLAGGLDELSRLPASTIQVLGAEKALFRALKTGANPPKHGIIFQHPFIHRASWWQRGKVARVLAGKLSIAARIDAYSGEYQADELKYILDRRIEDIKKKYPKPTARKEPPKYGEPMKYKRERFGKDMKRRDRRRY